jgi:DNA-binding MarR family transcriptional regulator
VTMDRYGFPEGVTIREITVDGGRRSRRRSTEFMHFEDLPSLTAAALMSKQALILLMLVHHRSRVIGSEWVTLPQSVLGEWGVGKATKSRALAALAEMGLVEINQSMGRTARVRHCTSRRDAA